MTAPLLPFDVEIHSVPPVQGATPAAREARTPQETRRAGRTVGALSRVNLWTRMLAIYAKGPLTDDEMRRALRVDRTTVNARRHELMTAGKVKSTGRSITNQKTGVPNILWELV